MFLNQHIYGVVRLLSIPNRSKIGVSLANTPLKTDWLPDNPNKTFFGGVSRTTWGKPISEHGNALFR